MVMISARPPEVEDRAVPVHWEGDVIIGKGLQSAVGTLVERTSRFVLRLHLPVGREAIEVNEAMKTAITDLPAKLVRTITWDQGREMARHLAFTVDTAFRCTSATPTARGRAARTRTPTASCASICRRAPTRESTARRSWPGSPEAWRVLPVA
jgi:IS30 family transposase